MTQDLPEILGNCSHSRTKRLVEKQPPHTSRRYLHSKVPVSSTPNVLKGSESLRLELGDVKDTRGQRMNGIVGKALRLSFDPCHYI